MVATEDDLALIARLISTLRTCQLCGAGFHPALEASRLLFPGGERRQICLACESEFLCNTLEATCTRDDATATERTSRQLRARSIQLRHRLAHREERLRHAMGKVAREREWLARQPRDRTCRRRLRALETLGFRMDPAREHPEGSLALQFGLG